MEKGSVYFVKHNNMSPIKIGYSKYTNPKSRFETMASFSPYGYEVVGIIICDNPNQIEAELHQIFAKRRLIGEWFNITREECLIMIDKFGGSTDYKPEEFINNHHINKTTKFSIFRRLKDQIMNKTELAEMCGVSRRQIYRWIEKTK